MSKKLDLYYFPSCPFCRRVAEVITELGMEKRIEMKNTMESEEALNFLLEKTGKRTVPCLFIDGVPMFESADIIRWLKENC